MDDWELIGEFVGKGSAGAFEALVGRYLGMVYGVAMREVGEHHLAEDVAQAVFALLAVYFRHDGRYGTICVGESIAAAGNRVHGAGAWDAAAQDGRSIL